MNVNIFEEEMTDVVEIKSKVIAGQTYVGLCFQLTSSFFNDDASDYNSITFWEQKGLNKTLWGDGGLNKTLLKGLRSLVEYYNCKNIADKS